MGRRVNACACNPSLFMIAAIACVQGPLCCLGGWVLSGLVPYSTGLVPGVRPNRTIRSVIRGNHLSGRSGECWACKVELYRMRMV